MSGIGGARPTGTTTNTSNTTSTTQTTKAQEVQPTSTEGAAAKPAVAQQTYESGGKAAPLPAATTPSDGSLKAGVLTLANPPAKQGSATPVDVNDKEKVAASTTPLEKHVQVPYYSQYEGGHGYTPGDKSCALAAKAMAQAAGGTPQGADTAITTGTAEDANGRLTIDSKKAAEGRAYIDAQLDAGKPVVVGVSHQETVKNAKGKPINADGLTDHFVVITGRGKDENGKTFYTFADPGTKNADKGQDTNPKNRFYPQEDGSLVRDGKGPQRSWVIDRRFEVSSVVKNS